MSNNYQRLFYIFKNMDSDIGHPTGYIRVEINYEVAKLQISLSNLLNRQGLRYQLYGIKKDDKQLVYTAICDVPNENGRADIKVNLDRQRVGPDALSLEDINIFAIITQVPNKVPLIKCPLVAYTKSELNWKREFEELLLNRDKVAINDKITNDEVKNSTKSDVVHQDTSADIGNLDEIGDFEQDNGAVQLSDILDDIGLLQDADDVVAQESESTETKASKAVENEGTEVSELELVNEGTEVTGIAVENEKTQVEEVTNEETQVSVDSEDGETKAEEDTHADIKETLESKDNSYDILSSVQKNFKDISSIEVDQNKIKNELNMPSLKEEIDKSFESYNPFKMKSKRINWWKINSPGYLNNILFRNNIKTYLLFNPKVMLAHYKYRYIIFGIRNDRHLGREYLICGVPGVYSIDENPFGNMGSWAQLEGYKPKYGAFGYWVILIDPRTGKLMKVK